MHNKHATDGVLFERCVNLINEVFPGAKDMITEGKTLGADWQTASIPFVIEKNGHLIAHLGIVPLTFHHAQKNLHVAALHGICVKEAYRGQGYFKQLMMEALAYIQSHFDASLLFTDTCELYRPFGYQDCPQVDFLIKTPEIAAATSSTLRRLCLQDPADLALFDRLHQHRVELAGSASIRHRTLYLLNSLDMKLFYAKNIDAIIVYKAHKKLYIQDVMCSHPFTLPDILNALPEKYPEVILQFNPTELFDSCYETIPAKTQGNLMICERFVIPHTPFRFSEMARC